MPTDVSIHQDHIYPKKNISQLEGYDRLTTAERKLIETDPMNMQPLPASYNCSKNCRSFDTDPWERYKTEELDPDYMDWLEDQQLLMRDHLQERIREITKGR